MSTEVDPREVDMFGIPGAAPVIRAGRGWAALPSRGVLDEVTEELRRQDEKWGQQNHPDGDWRANGSFIEHQARSALNAGEVDWGAILLEEVGEALQAESPAALRAELLQVAAVAVQWVKALDRRAR